MMALLLFFIERLSGVYLTTGPEIRAQIDAWILMDAHAIHGCQHDEKKS